MFFKSLKKLINPHEPMVKFEVDSFTVYVMDKRDLNKKHKELAPKEDYDGYGFYRYKTGDIYCSYDYFTKDKHGNFLPRFSTLGHELFHKILGDFHK